MHHLQTQIECLIIKTSALGDVIQSFAVVEYLHHTFDNIAIDWMVEKPLQDLVQCHPYVRNVIAINTKQWREKYFLSFKEINAAITSLRQIQYNFAVDLQGNSKSAIVTMLCRAKDKIGFGSSTVAEWPNVLATNIHYNPPLGQNITQNYLSLVKSYCADPISYQPKGVTLNIPEEKKKENNLILSKIASQSKKFLVCPTSRWQNKKLPVETWCAFLQKIADYAPSHFLFLWGSETEKQEAEKLQNHFKERSTLIPKMNLAQLQNLMSQVDCVLAVDSMALHLSATANTPSFSIFGPSSAQKYAPLNTKSCSLQGICPYGQVFEKRCTLLRSCKTGACMQNLSAETLFQTFVKMHHHLLSLVVVSLHYIFW